MCTEYKVYYGARNLIDPFFVAIEMSSITPLFIEKKETETEVAKKASWDQANKGEKLGLVWRDRKKISQIINDYFYLPFLLLIIL